MPENTHVNARPQIVGTKRGECDMKYWQVGVANRSNGKDCDDKISFHKNDCVLLQYQHHGSGFVFNTIRSIRVYVYALGWGLLYGVDWYKFYR